MTKTYIFNPVGLDIYDRRVHSPQAGTLVRKVQPYGCPRNGTMGHCYVEDAQDGTFYGLVLLNSLTPFRLRKNNHLTPTAAVR